MNEKKQKPFSYNFLIIAFYLSNLMLVAGAGVFTAPASVNSTVSQIGKYCFIGTIPSYLAAISLGFLIKGRKFVRFAPGVIVLTFVLAILTLIPIFWLID